MKISHNANLENQADITNVNEQEVEEGAIYTGQMRKITKADGTIDYLQHGYGV